MARIIVNRGLDEAARRIAGLTPSTHVQSMAWDNATGAANAFTAASSNMHGAGTFVVNAVTATTQASRTIRYESTLTTGQLNGSNIGRISLHQAATASVSTSSTTLYAGIDQQTIAKTSEFSLVSRLEIQHRTT